MAHPSVPGAPGPLQKEEVPLLNAVTSPTCASPEVIQPDHSCPCQGHNGGCHPGWVGRVANSRPCSSGGEEPSGPCRTMVCDAPVRRAVTTALGFCIAHNGSSSLALLSSTCCSGALCPALHQLQTWASLQVTNSSPFD